MAEPKKKKIVSASTGEEVKPGSGAAAPNVKPAAPVGKSAPLRWGAAGLWVLALVFEVLAVLVMFKKINLGATESSRLTFMLIFLALDLVCVIVGAQLWKKANRISPASEANALKFWLWNNMGVIVCAFAFVPFVILALSNKDLDKRTKTIATVAAVVFMLIAGVASYDFDPVSQEQLAAAEAAIHSEVYWTRFGKVYHTHTDCQALNQSEELTMGSVDQAVAANRTRLCAFCAKRDDIQGVKTDGADVSDYIPESETVTAESETAETETEESEAAA